MARHAGASKTAAKTPSKKAESAYVRIADIASGGVGHVVLALRREGSFERLYAVKRLRAEHRDDDDFRTMFFEEARLAGYVRHANVVSVLDVGEDDEGPFLVMDYVEGVPLSALVRHAQRSGTELPLQIALRIGIEVARGLHAAHELVGPDGSSLGLVHRDVSPQNILVGFDGVTRVTDFGVAKAFGGTSKTVTGVLKGKLGYMAPEQFRFEPVDRRTDIFALGVVLYELLVGGRLYRSVEEYDGVRRILDEPPPDLGDKREDAPPQLVELVFSMLAKSPAQRPTSALEVARVLEEILAEVESTDGRLDVSEFVSGAFAVEREQQSSRARLRPKSEHPPAREAARWVWPVGIALAALLALGVGLAFATAGGSADTGGAAPPERDTSASAEPARVAEASTRGATQPPQTPVSPALAEPAIAEPAIAEPVLAEPVTDRETDDDGASPRVRPRRRPHAPTAEHPATGVPQWDWQ